MPYVIQSLNFYNTVLFINNGINGYYYFNVTDTMIRKYTNLKPKYMVEEVELV